MRWTKLGKIFDPTTHRLPNNCQSFAQAPQALVFDNFVRIYFSTREVDQQGKFRSHVAFVDFERDLRTIRQVARHTVIPLGRLGCFDEHGIFPMHVTRHENRILAFTSGLSRRASVSVESSIGLAESLDGGDTFVRHGDGPVLTASLHEPFLVCDPFVVFLHQSFHMWYVYGVRWIPDAEKDKAPSRVYKIGHATSSDGKAWQKEGRQIISDVLGADECQALPTVIRLNDRLHMFFCYRKATDFRKNRDASYRLGYAFSNDGGTWTREDESAGIDVTEGDWDGDMMCYPHLFKCDDKVFLLYNGNEFGRTGFGLAQLDS